MTPQEALATALKLAAEVEPPDEDEVLPSAFYSQRLVSALESVGFRVVPDAVASVVDEVLADCPEDWAAGYPSDEATAVAYVRQLEKRCDRLGISRHRRSPLEVD